MTVTVSVPAELGSGDKLVSTAEKACERVAQARGAAGKGQQLPAQFRHHVVSALMEVFNNIVLHGFAKKAPQDILVTFQPKTDGLQITIKDQGEAFDFEEKRTVGPDLYNLSESGMGLYIIQSCMDDVEYTPGPPNTLHLFKSARGD